MLSLEPGDSERAAFRAWVDEEGGFSGVTVEFSGSGFRDLDSWNDFLESCSRLAARRISLLIRGGAAVVDSLRSFGLRSNWIALIS